MVHDDLMDNIRLDGVVTLVDAKHVEQHLDDKEKSEGAVNEAVEQIAYADRILLNKVDLVSPALTPHPTPPKAPPAMPLNTPQRLPSVCRANICSTDLLW